MYFAKQTFTVIGMSASGRSATSALIKRGAKTYMYDDDERRLEAAARLFEKSGAIKAASVEDAVTQSDVIVLSPGVKLDQPYLIKARHDKKRIIGELELGFLLARCPFIGVTGTNGKTTVTVTSTWTLPEGAEIVKAGTYRCYVDKGAETPDSEYMLANGTFNPSTLTTCKGTFYFNINMGVVSAARKLCTMTYVTYTLNGNTYTITSEVAYSEAE